MSTKIEWCDTVWNPTVGCSRVSSGCQNCYAERVAHRGMSPQHRGLTVLGKHGPRWTGEVRFLPDRLAEPLRWRKPRRVFVNSMSDLFHEKLTNEQIAAVFGVMGANPTHTFQVLTKRPRRMLEWFAWLRDSVDGEIDAETAEVCWQATNELGRTSLDPIARARRWPLPGVWLGVSVENQATADERIPLLLETPAAIRWVSYEPALGPVDFTRFAAHGLAPRSIPLDWIVVGGESGAGARGFDLAWAAKTIEDCRAAGVPVFCKQVGPAPYEKGWAAPHPRMKDRKGGDMAEWPSDLRVREFPEVRDV